MGYDARSRERYRYAVSAVTGLATLGVVTACGWVAGVAAEDHHAQQEAKLAADRVRGQRADHAWNAWLAKRAAWQRAQVAEIKAHPVVRTVWRQRPVRTVVDTRVVHVAATGTGGAVTSSGSGGTGSYSSGSTGGGSTGSSSGSGSHASTSHASSGGHSAPTHTSSGGSSAAAPPPPPPPAPTHGS